MFRVILEGVNAELAALRDDRGRVCGGFSFVQDLEAGVSQSDSQQRWRGRCLSGTVLDRRNNYMARNLS